MPERFSSCSCRYSGGRHYKLLHHDMVNRFRRGKAARDHSRHLLSFHARRFRCLNFASLACVCIIYTLADRSSGGVQDERRVTSLPVRSIIVPQKSQTRSSFGIPCSTTSTLMFSGKILSRLLERFFRACSATVVLSDRSFSSGFHASAALKMKLICPMSSSMAR